jgi:SsrA-binding protein
MPILATNKRASFDYKLHDVVEAGLMLLGHEVKSVKNGHVSLKGSYISFRYHNGIPEPYLIAAHISKYKQAGHLLDDYDVLRERKILLNKKEINYLLGKKNEGNLTLVPVKIYTKSSLVKIAIALGEGKKKYDKREDLKKKAIERDLRTLTKRQTR